MIPIKKNFLNKIGENVQNASDGVKSSQRGSKHLRHAYHVQRDKHGVSSTILILNLKKSLFLKLLSVFNINSLRIAS